MPLSLIARTDCFEADGRDLIAPRIDRCDAVPRAGFDRFAQIPLLRARSQD